MESETVGDSFLCEFFFFYLCGIYDVKTLKAEIINYAIRGFLYFLWCVKNIFLQIHDDYFGSILLGGKNYYFFVGVFLRKLFKIRRSISDYRKFYFWKSTLMGHVGLKSIEIVLTFKSSDSHKLIANQFLSKLDSI